MLPIHIIIAAIFVLILSCSTNNQKVDKSNGKAFSSDNITEVDISYYPSFTNSSKLHLNKIRDSVTFTVDTRTLLRYGRPDTIKFILSDSQTNQVFKSFWDSKFIYSLKQDTSMLGWTDGMSVYISFLNNGIRDSVYLGNVYPKFVDSILLQQINLLEVKTTIKATKAYLRQLKEYL